MAATSRALTDVNFLSLRMRPEALRPVKWRLPACPRLSLPVAVILKRLRAPRWVFNFIFGFEALRGMVKIFSWAKYGGGVRRITKSYDGANGGAAFCALTNCSLQRSPPYQTCDDRFLSQLRSVRNDGESKWRGSLRLLNAGSRLSRRFRDAGAFFGSQKSDENVAFHAGHGLNLRLIANIAEQAVHLGPAHFLVSHFAAAMKDHGAHLVAIAEEPDNLVFANLIIVLRGVGPKFDFLQLRGAAALALLVSLFVLLVLIFPVIRNFADRRVGRGRDFHEIESFLSRQLHGLEGLHDAELRAIFVNHPDFACPNPLVYACAVTLPEVAFSDKSPSKR